MPAIFEDRRDAGRQLAEKLSAYGDEDTIILGMPRGGVIVADEIARALKLPLDVIVARKIGAPGQPEFAIGAIACNDVKIFNEEMLRHFKLGDQDIQRMVEEEKAELERRMRLYSGKDQLPAIKDRTVIIVDDGVATGLTALATIRAVKKMNPRRLIFAAGVCAADSAKKLGREVDEVVCVEKPVNFYAVGAWYVHFDQTSDEEVIQALRRT